jgi:tetratricopeptide (TPR) repeat protein
MLGAGRSTDRPALFFTLLDLIHMKSTQIVLELCAVSILAFSLVSCAPVAKKGTVPPALVMAWDKVQIVTGDDEAKYSQEIRLVRQGAEFNDYDWAIQNVNSIGGAQRGLALAMLAWDAANSNHPVEAKRLIKLADSDGWIVSDTEGAMREAYLAGAEARLGMGVASTKRGKEILDANQKVYAEGLILAANLTKNPEFQIPDKERIRQDVIPLTIHALIPTLANLETSRSQKEKVFHLAENLVTKADPVNAIDCWSQLAVAAQNGGLQGEASIAAYNSRDLAKAVDARTEDFAIGLKNAAVALWAIGDKAEAISCLELASVKPELIGFYFQPHALMAIAEGYEKIGDREKAKVYWLKAIERAKGHHHPRARQMNVVTLLMAMSRAGVYPEPEVVAVMDSIARGEGGDAPLPPGYVKTGDTRTDPVKAPEKQNKKQKVKGESKTPST